MILHDYLPSGNGYKVRLLLAQLGIPFRRIEYDIDRGETRTPEFLEGINPNGRIPVLETDEGELLAESDAILFYLAEDTPFLPEGQLERARVLRWMFSSSSTATIHRTPELGFSALWAEGGTMRFELLPRHWWPGSLPPRLGIPGVIPRWLAGTPRRSGPPPRAGPRRRR